LLVLGILASLKLLDDISKRQAEGFLLPRLFGFLVGESRFSRGVTAGGVLLLSLH
jgi:hypothetical protein